MELDLFSLECNELSSSEFWGVCGFGMSLSSLYFNAQGCFPALLKNKQVNLALEIVGSWVVLDFSVGTQAFMSFCLLMFPGIGSSLVFSSFGFKPPALAFSLILTVASSLLHPYSTGDKTYRLMVKRLSRLWRTQRNSQSYREKRRGRREIDMTRRRRGVVKMGETNLGNQFLKCSPQPGMPREFQRVK